MHFLRFISGRANFAYAISAMHFCAYAFAGNMHLQTRLGPQPSRAVKFALSSDLQLGNSDKAS